MATKLSAPTGKPVEVYGPTGFRSSTDTEHPLLSPQFAEVQVTQGVVYAKKLD